MLDDDWEPANDYEDQMDAIRLGLQSETDSYCRHGTFVGNWAGPDYMCGYCEMGVSDEEWEEGKRLDAERNKKRKAAHVRWAEIVVGVESGDVDQETALDYLKSEEGKWLFR